MHTTVIRRSAMLALLACILPSVVNARQLSTAQLQYLSKQGKPDFFYVTFQDSILDTKTKRLTKLNPPSTSEVWYYAAQGMRYLFVNGKMDSTRPVDAATLKKLLPATTLKPSDLAFGMHRAEIEQRYGKPDSIEEAQMDNHKIAVLRYLTPAKGIKSFTLADDQLRAALVGFAFNQKKQ